MHRYRLCAALGLALAAGSAGLASAAPAARPTKSAKLATEPMPATNRSGRSEAASARGAVLFNGSLESAWALNQSASASRVQFTPSPGAGGPILWFNTLNSDVAPLTPTANPRSQLVTPFNILRLHEQAWESFEVYLPQDFPSTTGTSAWISLGAPIYGAPWLGTPPATISIEDGRFRFQRNAFSPVPWSIAWSMPVLRQQWIRFTWHFLISADPSTGWIAMYVNDHRVLLADGAALARRLPIALVDPTDSTGPWFSDLQLYYEHGAYPDLRLAFRDFRIATTQAAAER